MSNDDQLRLDGRVLTIYTGNHISPVGISDFVELITKAADIASLSVNESKTLKGDTILFIDEFSCHFELKALVRDKVKNHRSYVLLCTEFETLSGEALSFNEFERRNWFSSFLIGVLANLLFYTPKLVRKSKILMSVLTLCAMPMLTSVAIFELSKTQNPLAIFKNIRRTIYMRSRRRGYEIFKKYCDMLIKIHPLVNRDRNQPVLYPILEGQLNTTSKRIRLSGTETSYRLYKCNEFSRKLNEHSLGYKLDFSGKIRFDTGKDKDRWAFSYQPAQSLKWEMANPVKIWRDMHLHHTLPIVDRKFDQHPIENVAILASSFLTNAFNYTFIQSEIGKYNKFAIYENNTLFRDIMALT